MTGTTAYHPVLINMIRRVMPQIIADDIFGTSLLRGPVSDIFKLRHRYGQEIRTVMSKEHYQTFLRINDRPRTQPLRVFRAAGYPTVDLLKYHDGIPAVRWCEAQFGEHGYQRFDLIFIFKDEADATLFKMTWL
jgi:hypothetical protein